MVNALQSFAFEDHLVRVLDQGGRPWFVLSDVCRVLDIQNIGNASARLDADEKSNIQRTDVTSAGGNPNITIINESGLWSLVLTSRKPEAKRFKKWVTSEVLPAIHRTGQYQLPGFDAANDQPAQLLDFDSAESRLAIATRLEIVRAAMRIFGRKGAMRAWDLVGLPCLVPERAEELLASIPPCVAAWLAARCHRRDGARTQAAVLYEDYAGWVQQMAAGREPVSRVAFASALVAAGFESRKSSVIYWQGIILADVERMVAA